MVFTGLSGITLPVRCKVNKVPIGYCGRVGRNGSVRGQVMSSNTFDL